MSKNVTTFEKNMEWKVLSKTKAGELKILATKKGRDKTGSFLAEGEKCVIDMLPSFNPEYLLATSHWLEHHKEIVAKYQEKVLMANKNTLSIISSLSSLPDVIGVFKIPSESVVEVDQEKLYLLLDEIQDPGNLGTIIRTCDWFGVYDIFASKTTVDVFSPKVVQSTMGSLSRVNVTYLDLESLIKDNPEMKVLGTILDGVPLNDTKLPQNGFLLMGNEGRGISEPIKRLISTGITIPPVNPESHPDSLNVAIATAIILSHIRN